MELCYVKQATENFQDPTGIQTSKH